MFGFAELPVISKVFALDPCYGPLLDSGGVCCMGPYLVYGIEWKKYYIGVQIRGAHRKTLGSHACVWYSFAASFSFTRSYYALLCTEVALWRRAFCAAPLQYLGTKNMFM